MAGARATRVDVDPATGALGAVHYRQASAPDPAAAPSSPLVAGASGLVLALGASGLRPLLAASPGLAAAAPSLCSAAAEPSIDVLSLRLWLDRRVSLPQPANVLSRFPDLAALAGPNAGATFFSLDDLQAEGGTCARGMRRLWGHDPGDGSVDASALGSVIACDVYWAGPLLPQPDAAIVALFLDRLLPACVPALRSARLLDSCVLRCPAAVTHFRPGSFGARPATSPAPAAAPWLAAAGDWARLGAAREHGAKGLCQERALVTGLEAGNALLRSGALRTPRGAPAAAALPYPLHPVRPVRDAEPQVVAARAAARAAAALAAAIRPGWWGPPPPSSSP